MGKENLHNYTSSILETSINNIPDINWGLLAKAQQYYQEQFLYQETPFIVPVSYNKLTKPHDEPSFILNNGIFKEKEHELVGSAEQGFIYLALRKQLKSHKLCSISPCFRSDDYDSLHFPWFMKLELFHLSNDPKDILPILNYSLLFFKSQFNGNYTIIQTAEQSWDILLNGIEIGSYGLRILDDLQFIYGTGLALPRFSQAIQMG